MRSVVLLLTSLATLLLISFSQGLAFTIPDILSLGANPEILQIEPSYLIPGTIVKIKGKNFYSSPKSANKLWINNSPIRISKATSDEIEFIVPKLSLSKARLRFYTSYLGYKSKEITYPQNNNEFIDITINPPHILHTDKIAVKPQEELFIYGSYKSTNPIYFKIREEGIIGTLLSNNICKIRLPEKLPYGPFTISSFYKVRDKDIDSIQSNELILFNTELGVPLSIKLRLSNTTFNQLDFIDKEYPYTVELIFSGLEKSVDVTKYTAVSTQDQATKDLLEINSTKQTIKLKKKGIAKIKAQFIWLPTNLILEDEVSFIVDPPKDPILKEVIINEVFPFATPAIQATDSNKDGFAKNSDDFIELKNLTDKTLNLSACQIFINENTKPSFELKESTISPSSFIVLSGNNSIDKDFNLTNTGGTIELKCNKNTIDYAYYPSGKNGDPSWQRKKDLSGFIKHSLKLFSPGEELNEQEPTTSAQESSLIPDSIKPVQPIPVISNPIPQNITSTNITLKEIFTTPASLTFEDSNTQQLSVYAKYTNGETRDITKECTFKTYPQDTIIKIDSGGLVTPLANGAATIEISYQDKTLEILSNINLISKIQLKQLVINEVLAAPITDTNKDGIFKSDQDEFVEIVNISGSSLDLSGLLISDGVKVRHTVPFGTILNNLEPLIIFGGGDIMNLTPNYKAQIASTGSLGINNSGLEQITITTLSGLTIDSTSFDNANLQGISLNRSPELSFNTLIPHDKFLRAIDKYSPGIRIDGTSFQLLPQIGYDELKNLSSSSSGLILKTSSSSSSGSLSTTSSSSSGFTNTSSSGFQISTSSSSSSSGLILKTSSSSSSSGV